MRVKTLPISCLIFMLLLAIIQPHEAWGLTSDIRVAAKPDDAHEKSTDGKVEIDKNELILGTNVIGLRFANVFVPQGSTIISAYIEFAAKENGSTATNLTIRGQAADNAPEFVKDTFNTISNRTKTTASTSWGVPAWTKDQNYRTPDLTAIVQEIINRDGGGMTSGWQVGNSLAFIFTGSGSRKARSWDDKKELAPLLHIEYTSNSIVSRISSGTDEANEKSDEDVELYKDELKMGEKTIGLRFQNLTVPKGSIITKAFIEFVSKTNENELTSLIINAENGDSPPQFIDALGNVTNRAKTNHSVQWNNLNPWVEEGKYRSPDLSVIVQEIMSRSGWLDGNSMVFIVSGNGKREAISYHKDPAKAPVLFIEFLRVNSPLIEVDTNKFGAVIYEGANAQNAAFKITNSGAGNLNFSITQDSTWISCSQASGALGSGDSASITLTYNTSALRAGIHEAHVTVTAPNSTNKSVEIDVRLTVLAVPEAQVASCGHIPLYSENLITPAILVLLDVSGSMGWDIPISSQSKPYSPNISGIVQEIVNLAEWQSGNPMSFIITGSGKRTATSYDGSSGSAPLLKVEYIYEGVTYKVNFRVAQSSDDAEERISDGHMDLGSTDLDLIYDGVEHGGNQKVGIRFQNVTIPAGANVTQASLEFVVDESDSESTSLKISGVKLANSPTFSATAYAISSKPITIANVNWNTSTQPPLLEWVGPTLQRRIDAGKVAISELMKDPNIAWGFGTWTTSSVNGYISAIDYTKIHAGCKPLSDEHAKSIHEAIAASQPLSNTPLAPALLAANKYFMGQKKDKDGAADGETYVSMECQPKFLILVTDGLGNTDTTLLNVEKYTKELSDQGVSTIAVGFGIDNAVQIQKIAEISNQKAHLSPENVPLDKKLYVMHEEVNGIGQPYIANSKEQLVEALGRISERIKNKVKFYGSAPAPTNSVDLGDMVIATYYDPSNWSGEIEAIGRSDNGKWDKVVWRASEVMAASTSRKIFSMESNQTTVKNITAEYQMKTKCKILGDIINSTPVVVGTPPFFYNFDNYSNWRRNIEREPLIYVGANDGAMHVFSLKDGKEKWAFVPENLLGKMNLGDSDPKFDQCSYKYCHQYFVDGSPQVSDIYVKEQSKWKTILVSGEREGGSAFFALDITSGKPLDDGTDPSRHLWQFSDTELGQTWAEPAIERIKESTATCTDSNGNSIDCTTWGVFFGSGYSSANQSSKAAYFYGIQAHNKASLWKDPAGNDINRIRITPYVRLAYDRLSNNFNVGQVIKGAPSGASAKVVSVQEHDNHTGTLELDNVTGMFKDNDDLKDGSVFYAKVNDTLASPLLNDVLSPPLVVDLDDDNISDHIYVGNLYGTMYRITNIGKGQAPAISKLFDFNPYRTSPNENPIRSVAAFAYGPHKDDGIWVYYGTGRFESQADKTNMSQQYFLGLKDSKSLPLSYVYNGAVSDPNIVKLVAKYIAHPTRGVVRYIDGVNNFNKSWVIKLDASSSGMAGSERVIEKPLVVGGIVFFTTFIPDEDPCKGGGETWVFALDYQTGLAPATPVFDLNGDGKFDNRDKVVIGDVVYNVAGFRVGSGKGSHPVLHKNTLFVSTSGSVQSGGGKINEIKVNLPAKKVKLESWKQK